MRIIRRHQHEFRRYRGVSASDRKLLRGFVEGVPETPSINGGFVRQLIGGYEPRESGNENNLVVTAGWQTCETR